MKQRKFFCLCLLACIITACGSLGAPSQSSNPNVNEPNINTPLPPPTEPEKVNFPQMTQTALALPTVFYPTNTPMSPEALFDLSQSKTTSPDGKHVITCDYTFPTLFYAPTKTIVSTIKGLSFRCENGVFWSPDNSYVFIVASDPDGTLYRWRVDGSQPEMVGLNIPPNQTGGICDAKIVWSPDAQYIAIEKGCGGLYIVKSDDEVSFENPVLIESYYFEDFRWATSRLLMIDYHRAYGFFYASTGKELLSWSRSGGGCLAQPPFISPNENWIVVDQCWAGGGAPFYDQYALTNLENGSTEIFSKASGDRIEFIGWKPDSSEFYLVSRPTTMNAHADPRTPFGLLALNPKTLQARNLFEQAQYISFNKDFTWAYVVFPVKNQGGDLRLDGGLWQVGSSQLLGQQIMASAVDERFLNPYRTPDTGYMYSADGKELGFSSQTVNRPLPGVWSHDNTRVATINSMHQLVVIGLNGEVEVIGQLKDNQEWLFSKTTWSDDNEVLDVDGTTWSAP